MLFFLSVSYKKKQIRRSLSFFCLFFLLIIYIYIFFLLSRATPAAYGGSQARDLIGVVAAGLHQSHSNARSETSLPPTPQLLAGPGREFPSAFSNDSFHLSWKLEGSPCGVMICPCSRVFWLCTCTFCCHRRSSVSLVPLLSALLLPKLSLCPSAPNRNAGGGMSSFDRFGRRRRSRRTNALKTVPSLGRE